jgi:hypothetical protein
LDRSRAVHRFGFYLAGSGIAFETKDANVSAELASLFPAAATTDRTDFDLVTQVEAREDSSSGSRVLHIMADGSVSAVESAGYAGELMLDDGLSRITVSLSAETFALQNYIRLVTAILTLRHGGLLLHASSVIRDGLGYVFFGPSGAGKTTAAYLSTAYLVTGDDLTAIRLDGNSVVLHGLPFRGSNRIVDTHPGTAPLARLLRLEQAPFDRLEAIPRGIATAMLAAHAPWMNSIPAFQSRLFEVCEEVTVRVPPQRLHFRKSSEFWTVL